MIKKYLWICAISLTFVHCGHDQPENVKVVNDSVVVKSRYLVNLQMKTDQDGREASLRLETLSNPEFLAISVPITATNGVSTLMVLDTSQFNVPQISQALVDFGFLSLAVLKDNNLNVCGQNGKQHCGFAMVRMYTTGVAGAGLWNDYDKFGAPIKIGATGQVVGLGSPDAAVLQKIALPPSKHVVNLTDFTPLPHYNVKVDFTEAGAGTYSTTLVIEYALSN